MDRIREIQSLILRMAGGDLDARGQLTHSGDEMDAIMAGLNMLAEELAVSQAALKEANARLEKSHGEIQSALNKSHERWKLALEGSGDGLWDWDILTGEVYYSPRWEEMFGFEVGTAARNLDAFSALVHPDDLDGMFAEVNRYLRREIPLYAREFRMIHRKGMPMWTLHRAAAIFDEGGRPVRMIGTTADITDRKKAEKEVIRIHEMLLRTNSVARIGGWELNLVTGELFWSDITREIHEVSPDYEPDLDTAINFYKEGTSRDRITEVVNRAIQTGEAYDVELQIVTGAGREVWVNANGEAEFKDGKCLRIYGTFQDIDGRKKGEEELIRTREQALIANRAKTEFLAHMSHELRTPLNAILGFTQLLRTDALHPGQAERLETIQSSGEHLLTLIEDVLDMSKIESGKLELQNHEFSPDTLLRNVAAMIEIRAQERGLTFLFTTPDVPPDLVYGDPRKLRQVLLNLLSNAVKFTTVGRVELKVELSGERWKFSVTDTGVGIAPENQSRLFKPFQRLENERIVTQGSGLGLAISQKIVLSMGGEIFVESAPDRGSTFWFEISIPRVNRRLPPDRRKNVRPVGYRGDRKKILIVDDDLDNRRLLNVFLGPLGFELLEAVDGEDAIQKTLTWWPHLILLDLMMPVMDGFAACEKLRHTTQGKQARIIALSADAYPLTEKKILNSGGDSFLSKPVRFGELIAMVGEYLELDWVIPADQPAAP